MWFLKLLWSFKFIRYGISIVLGFNIALVLVMLCSYMIGFVLVCIENKKKRMIGIVAVTTLLDILIFGFTLCSICTTVFTTIFLIVLEKKERAVEAKIESKKYVFSETYDSNSCVMWGLGALNNVLFPMVVKLPEMICHKYGIEGMNVLAFYWSFEEGGLLSYIVIRFIFLAILFILPLGLLSIGGSYDEYAISIESVTCEEFNTESIENSGEEHPIEKKILDDKTLEKISKII